MHPYHGLLLSFPLLTLFLIPVSPRKIILANDKIEETLTKIINSLNHQLTYNKNGGSQRISKGKAGVQPTMGGRGGKKRTFSKVIQSDITETSGHHIVAMVAQSGSGKTAMVIHLAKKHFVIYVICEAVNTHSPDFSDRNFRILAEDVENMCSRLLKPVLVNDNRQKYMDDLSYDNQLKNLVREHIQLEFLACWISILFLDLFSLLHIFAKSAPKKRI